ncbi:MAG: TonB family protein [Muribaculaceae bacterium]|nr:TonB family protein [Muribaculaceae bacterium]
MKKIITAMAIFAMGFGINAYADSAPQFPGGEKALKKYVKENTRYPETAKENGVEGIVVIDFIVEINGQLQNFKVEKFVDPDLETEALRIVKGMPAWIPAEKEGSPVVAPAKVDVPFILE